MSLHQRGQKKTSAASHHAGLVLQNCTHADPTSETSKPSYRGVACASSTRTVVELYLHFLSRLCACMHSRAKQHFAQEDRELKHRVSSSIQGIKSTADR